MKKFIFFLLITGLLSSSCQTSSSVNDSETGIVGKYKLIEIYSDPGNGSGTFNHVDSDKTIDFFADSTVTSNGDLCSLSPKVESPSSGTYSIQDSLIRINGCRDLGFNLNDNELIIGYSCIEGCAAKYKRN